MCIAAIVKDFVFTLWGTYVFQDVPVNNALLVGISVSFVGACVHPLHSYLCK